MLTVGGENVALTVDNGTVNCCNPWDWSRWYTYPWNTTYVIGEDKRAKAYSIAKDMVGKGLVNWEGKDKLEEFFSLVETIEKNL